VLVESRKRWIEGEKVKFLRGGKSQTAGREEAEHSLVKRKKESIAPPGILSPRVEG